MSFFGDLFFLNSVDPDEMPHDGAFHLALHFLPTSVQSVYILTNQGNILLSFYESLEEF